MKTYKVWIEIEEIDERGDGNTLTGSNLKLPAPQKFKTVKAAERHAQQLAQIARIINHPALKP